MTTARPRALLLDQWGHFGGAQRVAVEVLALWRDWGWEIDAAFPLGGAFEAAVRRELGDAVHLHDLRLPALTTGRKTLRDAWRLWRAGATMPFPDCAATADLVHVNGPRLYAAWRRRNRVLRRPTAYHVHLHHGAMERALITRYVARDSRGVVIASSREVAAGLGAVGDGATGDGATGNATHAAARVRLVENAVPRALAGRAGAGLEGAGRAGAGGEITDRDFDDRWSAPLRWAVVGAWSPEKGQDLAIAAARALPEWELLLIGPTLPPHESWAAAQRAVLPANVRVLGAVDDVPAVLAAERVQVLALPSRRRESFSMAVVEAVASSCAALLTREAGMEGVSDAVGIPRVDGAEGLVRALRAFGNDPREGRALAQRQREALLRAYGPQRFAASLAAAYALVRPT